jgi:haloacetate dehalogenase
VTTRAVRVPPSASDLHDIGSAYDVGSIWRERAPDLRGRALDCGHFIAEERPDATAAELLAFLAE